MSNIPNDRKYAESHEWAILEAEDLVRVGISDFAQAQLGDVVFVDLPTVGKQVAAGDACLVIESVKAASDVYSPVSGEITAINEEVSQAPEIVNEDSYGNWLFCVKPSNLAELDALLDAEGYRAAIGEG
jgi:glycine cleavage system H protein